MIPIAMTPVRPAWAELPSDSSDMAREASNPQKMNSATRNPPSSDWNPSMAIGFSHCQENGSAVGAESPPRTAAPIRAANRISPPYCRIVSANVVRDDSSAPRDTSHVVSRMKHRRDRQAKEM